MADVFDRAERSSIMARVRSHGNRSTEIRLIKLMRNSGIVGWRRRIPLFGKPDFVFRRERVVVFVDGCFWHGCPVCGETPASNRHYWPAKIARNRKRDRVVTRSLRARGWKVIRVWECELRNPDQVIARLRRGLGRRT